MTQAEFALLVLQRAFHRPAFEADVQEDFERRSRSGVAEKIFFLLRVENVASMDDPVGAENLVIASEFDTPPRTLQRSLESIKWDGPGNATTASI
jgi:hypothetical protein